MKATVLVVCQPASLAARGSRSDFHFHIVSGAADGEHGDALVGGRTCDLAGLEVEPGAVPGAFDLLAFNDAFAQ